jgi:sorting nexin-8
MKDDLLGRSAMQSTNIVADPPASYLALKDSVDASSTGQISLTSLHRLLSTSQLPAATIERIINLTSHDQSSVSSQEFYCALALVGLAQQGKDVSIELLSQSLGNLPVPTLHAPRVQPSMPSWDTQDTLETSAPDPEDADRERGYYTRLEHVQVDLVPVKEGWFLTKYKVESDVGHLSVAC